MWSAVRVVYVNAELQLSRIGLDLGWVAIDVVQIQLETVWTRAERVRVDPGKGKLVGNVSKGIHAAARWYSVSQ